jgi:prepilin-type N-terminal cleavage/methylation domain-containing protein
VRPRSLSSRRAAGFTLIELLIGSAVMLIAVLGALIIYARSNKVSVEQQMVTEMQNDVRSSMFLVTRDLRMAGAGLPVEFAAYFVETWDNEDQGGEVRPDRIRIMGNIEDPLILPIHNYQGSSVVLDIYDYSFEQYPYPDAYYADKPVLVLPNPASACRAGEIRIITHVSHNADGSNERFNFSPGLAPGIDPPGGLSGTCSSSNDYDGGSVSFINVKEYWLDTTGHMPGLTAGVNGYIGGGVGGIFYCTQNAIHFPIARNIENFQVEFNGDMNNDSFLDGWSPWDPNWVNAPVARIQQVRIWLLGRTPEAFTSVSGTPTGGIYTYRRPPISNSLGSTVDDRHRRFLLDSTSNIRNMNLNLYNLGVR